MKPNQIKSPKTHAHALGRLPTLHNQIPTNEIKGAREIGLPTLPPRYPLQARSRFPAALGRVEQAATGSKHQKEQKQVGGLSEKPHDRQTLLQRRRDRQVLRCACHVFLRSACGLVAKRCESTDSIDCIIWMDEWLINWIGLLMNENQLSFQMNWY
jgi:hypothetical protein